MTGLMMKDALVMRKTLRLYALFLLFYSGLAVLGVFPMSMALAMVEVIVMVLPISSFSYDEAAKWDRYAAVLPVGRTAVVKARYLFLLLVLLAAAAIGLVGSILASLLAREDLGDSVKYIKITNTDKNGKNRKPVIEINQAKIEEDLKYAGYNLLVTSELDMTPLQVYHTYHNL